MFHTEETRIYHQINTPLSFPLSRGKIEKTLLSIILGKYFPNYLQRIQKIWPHSWQAHKFFKYSICNYKNHKSWGYFLFPQGNGDVLGCVFDYMCLWNLTFLSKFTSHHETIGQLNNKAEKQGVPLIHNWSEYSDWMISKE
jgi:hypothetical protein